MGHRIGNSSNGVRIQNIFWSNLVEFSRIYPETASGTEVEFPGNRWQCWERIDGLLDLWIVEEKAVFWFETV